MKQKDISKILSIWKQRRANRQYKDRLFRKIFNNKKDLLQLYNAINNTSYVNEEDLIITTLEDTIVLSMKNDLSFIISTDMNLYEHQSTFNPNMPIRGVLYFARLYKAYIQKHDLDVYGSRLIKLPTPQYVVFYNGNEDKPDRMVMKLSDAFELSEREKHFAPALECNVVMLNINYGHNEELLNNCKKLKEYAIFVSKVKGHLKNEDSLNIAIDKAIDECIEMNVLKDILLKQRSEVRHMLLTEYDEKKRRQLDRREGEEHGIELGIQQSIITILEEFGEIPADVREKIRMKADCQCLMSWVRIASKAESLEEFCRKADL